MRELCIGVDDGSGAVFIGDPSIPVDSELGVELLAVNAALISCWEDLNFNASLGLPTAHHEDEFDELAARQRALKAAIREIGDDRQ